MVGFPLKCIAHFNQSFSNSAKKEKKKRKLKFPYTAVIQLMKLCHQGEQQVAAILKSGVMAEEEQQVY